MRPFLDVLKKQWLSVVCGVIALAAVLFVFLFLDPKFAALQTKLNARAAEEKALTGLLTKSRTLPALDPTDPEPKKLEMYPTDNAIKAAGDVVTQFKAQAASVLDVAEKINEHTLLVPGSLPAGQTGYAVSYQTAYQQQVEFLSPDENIRNASLPVKVLHAGVPPTESEITAAIGEQETEIKNAKLIPGPNGNEAAVNNEIAQMKSTMGDEMRQKVASNSKMYISPDAMDVYPGVYNTPTPPVASTIYFSQIGLWVQDDVFHAIADANKNSTNVMDSPIKHLIKIDVLEDSHRTAGGASGGTPGTEAAAHTLTGRVSGKLYDVIPFHLVVYVDAQRIPQVLAALSRNRFITILNTNITPVDSTTAMLNGFYYGSSPIVMLNMDCETLFLSSWLSKFMPPALTAPTPAG